MTLDESVAKLMRAEARRDAAVCRRFGRQRVADRRDVIDYLTAWLRHPETGEFEHPQTVRAVRLAVQMLGGRR